MKIERNFETTAYYWAIKKASAYLWNRPHSQQVKKTFLNPGKRPTYPDQFSKGSSAQGFPDLFPLACTCFEVV